MHIREHSIKEKLLGHPTTGLMGDVDYKSLNVQAN